MRKLILSGFCLAAAVALVAVTAMAADAPKAEKQVNISGWITDSFCSTKAGAEKDRDCALKCVEKGAKLVLVVPEEKRSYSLDNQTLAKEHAGHEVSVSGTLDEATQTIKVNKIEMAAKGEKKG